MDGESGPLKMWQIWALYDIAADFYADPEQAADQAGPAAAVIDPFPHCQNLPFVLNFW